MYAHSTRCTCTCMSLLCCACRLLYSRKISLCKCHHICYPPQGHSRKSSSPCGCESTPTRRTQVRGCRYQSVWSLTTRTDFPSLHCLLVAPFLSSIEALQFLARALQKSLPISPALSISVCNYSPLHTYLFMWVSFWSYDCLAVLLFPDKSRPPLPE